ncbi:ABC transporter substrate-binding protein [Mycobacterium sp. 141]|uniref:ABC transporter substrate-binding protein n=1 Tax=Mycobacterium sp. 141 TaxID=1120797 RepID=UPI00037FB508|nr:ABC transporter substrate-binding protein [Mycobacterium sp. 141]
MTSYHPAHTMTTPRRRFMAASVVATLAVVVGACGSSSTNESTGSSPERAKVRFALDWTPNTNHTGLYVAINKGYFADAGIDVEVVPYNSSSPDVLVDSGQAEFGIGFQPSTSVAMAAGADLRSVLAVQQHWTTRISVLGNRDDIRSPADLDGLVYGGFGSASEEAIMRAVIQNAGGAGKFDTVVLGTTAYEALYSRDVDFTVPFVAWEGIEAERRGIKLKNFAYTDYGFPDSYQVIVTGNGTWLKEHPKIAAGFVQALARGYEDAVKDPVAAAAILQQENSDVLTDLDFLTESQKLLSAKYMLDQNGEFGRQTPQQWSELGKFLFDSGLLADADGARLTAEPDWTAYVTDEYRAG